MLDMDRQPSGRAVYDVFFATILAKELKPIL